MNIIERECFPHLPPGVHLECLERTYFIQKPLLALLLTIAIVWICFRPRKSH